MFITNNEAHFFLLSKLHGCNLKLNGNPVYTLDTIKLATNYFCKCFKLSNLIIFKQAYPRKGANKIYIFTYDNDSKSIQTE